jgi:hypothetical protein
MDWLNKLRNNTKLVKLSFRVLVHRTLTVDFDPQDANGKGIEETMHENDRAEQGFQVPDRRGNLTLQMQALTRLYVPTHFTFHVFA